MDQPEKVFISHTIDDMPPPYCYRYTIEIDVKKDFSVRFAVEYYDREELDPQEIEAEGFSLDDNFNWQGTLPDIWKQELLYQLERSDSGAAKKGIKITTSKSGKLSTQRPVNEGQFETFTQELIQAIYEAGERQNPLSIGCRHNAKGRKPEEFRLNISFLNRAAHLSKDGVSKAVAWEKSQKMLKNLFQYDYDPFNVIDKSPKKEGLFVDAGEGYWYEAGTAIKAAGKNNPKDDILRLFSNLL